MSLIFRTLFIGPRGALSRSFFWGCLIGLLALPSCNVTKHLDEAKGERLLIKNSLNIKSAEPMKVAAKTALSYELSGLYKEPANSKSFGLLRTRLWFYYRHKDRTRKFSKWVMKRIAEPPAIYNEDVSKNTARNFENLMRQRGYFNAVVTPFTTFKGSKKALTTYDIDLGRLYTIKSIRFESRDSNMLNIMHEIAGESEIKPGGAIDQRVFNAEKTRLTRAMKNRGYAYFIPNFVDFTGDSTGTQAEVVVEILPPSDTALHKIYTIGHMAVFSSLVPDYSSIRQDTTIGGVYFASSDQDFQVRPDRLYDVIAIHPDSIYRQDDFDRTIRKLNALGVFRFVSARPLADTIDPEKLNVDISFSPNQRLSIGGDVDLNSSTSSVSGRLFGLSASGTATNRNLFRGAELVTTNLGYNIEFDIANKENLIFSQEILFQNNLVFPRFIDYFGIWRSLHQIHLGKTRLISSDMYKRMKLEGQTHVTLSYDYLNIIDFYDYNLFKASFGYDVRSGTEHQYTFDNIGVDVLRPKLTERFDSIFSQNEFLRRSFDNQLFTGFIMRSFIYTYVGKPNAYGERWYLRFNAEISGLEEHLVNKAWSAAFGDEEWKIGDLDFAKFIRFDVDGSYSRDIKRNLSYAFRVGSGAVTPFADTQETPYVKQFFVGGPSSIRAWRIRELGPGSYYDSAAAQVQPFYQAATFRFEFNAEVRFNMFWWMKGALFLDGGNVWTFKPDPDRPGSELRWDSYKNIAMGTGFGFRGDFDYFIIRLDFGLKLRRPYELESGNGYWIDEPFNLRKNKLNPNLAIGLPF